MSVVAPALIMSAGAVVQARADETAPPSDFAVSGTAAIASQYRFRGLALSDNEPAVQGSLNVSHTSGFYAGVWASSAHPGPAIDFGNGEVDLYGGFDKPIGTTGLSVDLGVTSYFYIDANPGQRTEITGSLAEAIGPVTARAGIRYAPPQRAPDAHGTRHNTYAFGDLASDVPRLPLRVHGHVGHTDGALDFTKAYTDYAAGVTATWKKLSLDLAVVGTNISRADAAANPQGPAADPRETWRVGRAAGIATLTAQF